LGRSFGLHSSVRTASAAGLALVLGLSGCAGPERAPAEIAPVLAPGSPRTWCGWYPLDPLPELAADLDLAHTLATGGDPEGAIAVLDLALARVGSRAQLLQARGLVNAELGFLRTAERDFQHAAVLDPTCAHVWIALGRVRADLGLAQAALDAFQRARTLGGSGCELETGAARALRDLGRRGEALERYRAALSFPTLRTDLLVEAASTALDPAPERRGARARERAALDADAALAEAIGWAERAVEADVRCARGWLVLGLLQERRGDRSEPERSWRRAVDADPRCVEAWTRLAIAAHDRGDAETCADAVKSALRFERSSERREALQALVAGSEPTVAERR